MYIKRIISVSPVRNALVISFLLIISFASLRGQGKVYSFNSPGSKCYLTIFMFFFDSSYAELRRPFIFTLCKPDENVERSISRMILLGRHLSSVTICFVYLPNTGTTAGEKLACIEALAEMLTQIVSNMGKVICFLK